MRWAIILALCAFAAVTIAVGIRSLVPGVSNATTMQQPLVEPVASANRAGALLAGVRRDVGLRKEILDDINSANPWNRDRICAMAMQNGRPITMLNATSPVAPASVNKIFTAEVASSVLGPNTRFTTSVLSDGKPKGGVVEGPIYLVGGGDPMLSTNDYHQTFDHDQSTSTSLDTLADYVANSGIKKVTGGVVGDDRYLDDKRGVDGWDPNSTTSSQVGYLGGLMVNDGFPERSKGGRTADPAETAAATLATLLRRRGIEVQGDARRGEAPSVGARVASIESATVAQIIGEMSAFSDNTTAEIMLKQIGRKAKNEPSTAGGIRAVRDTLGARGVDLANTNLLDGSGLHHDNRTTCKAVLQTILLDGPESPLAKGFARSGQYGTLQGRLAGPDTAGRVVAKTGTLTEVAGLAGWAFPKEQAPIAFVCLLNNVWYEQGRVAQDRLAMDLVMAPKP